MRADEFHRVDRAAFQRRVDVAGGELRRHRAHLGEHVARQAGNAELQPLHVVEALDLLAEPAAHLSAGVAEHEGHGIVVLQQLLHQRLAAALLVPARLLTVVHAEGHDGEEGEGGILAGVVVGGGVAGLHRVVLHGIQRLQPAHDLARREEADLEPVVGELRHALRHLLGRAVEDVGGAGEGAGQAPTDFRHALRAAGGRRGLGGGGQGGRGRHGGGQQGTALHGGPPETGSCRNSSRERAEAPEVGGEVGGRDAGPVRLIHWVPRRPWPLRRYAIACRG